MKKIQSIIRPQKLEDVKTALTGAGVNGMTVREVAGHGRQKGFVHHYRTAETLVTLLPKIEIEVIVKDEDAAKVLRAIIAAAKTGEIGDGKIFVSDVLDAVRIRTEEAGDIAL